MNAPRNPYRPPAARVSRELSGDAVARPRGLMIVAIVVAVLTTLSAGIAPALLNSFREMFAGFGADLPWLSQVALRGTWIWWLFAAGAIGIAVWIARTTSGTRATFGRMRLTVGIAVVAVVALFIVTLIALYLPIFRLGDVGVSGA